MNNKIMQLIETAMMFKGERTAHVEFGSHINGVSVFVMCENKVVYRAVCYFDHVGVTEKLDAMKNELENQLNIKAA